MNVFHHPAPPEAPHHRFWPAGVPRALDVPDESLWQALERRAEAEPQAVGLDFLGRRWTWQALHDEAERLAGALLALGVGAGDRVIVFMQNCPQFLLGYHAVLRANAVVVPVNPMNKADEQTAPSAVAATMPTARPTSGSGITCLANSAAA